MPLIRDASRAAIGENIKTEEGAGKPRRQAIAIALHTARDAGAHVPRPADHGPRQRRAIRARLAGGAP